MKEHNFKYKEIYAETDKAIVYGADHVAIAYLKSRSKSEWHYNLKTKEKALEYAQNWAQTVTKNILLWEEKKKAKRENKKSFDARNSEMAGKIFHSQWGWEQTNNDFAKLVQITSKTKGFARLMNKEHFDYVQSMACYVLPKEEIGELIPCTISENSIRIHHQNGRGQSFILWDGSKNYESWYA